MNAPPSSKTASSRRRVTANPFQVLQPLPRDVTATWYVPFESSVTSCMGRGASVHVVHQSRACRVDHRKSWRLEHALVRGDSPREARDMTVARLWPRQAMGLTAARFFDHPASCAPAVKRH